MADQTFAVIHGCPIPLLAGDPGNLSVLSADATATETGRSVEQLQEIWDTALLAGIPREAEAIAEAGSAAVYPSRRRAVQLLHPHIREEDLDGFISVCQLRGLNELAGQVWGRYTWDAGRKREKLVILTTLDGMRAIAHATSEYDGRDEPKFELSESAPHLPVSATVTVHRFAAGRRKAFAGLVWWDECYPGDADGQFWQKMPRHMLEKCAEAKALRMAFPQQLGSIYTTDEITLSDRPTSQRGTRRSRPSPSEDRAITNEIDLEAPDSSFRFHQALHECQVTSESKRNLLVKMMQAKFPGMLERDDAEFYTTAWECIRRNPSAYGVVLPTSTG